MDDSSLLALAYRGRPATVAELATLAQLPVTGIHDAVAREVDRETFFHTRESGGTITAPVSTATPVQTGHVVDALFVAIRQAGHQPSVLAFKRKAPIRLGEAEGVRLALVLLATQPITKHERVRALVTGINAMSIEETYYWYSKCTGLDGNCARKALRTLLAD